MSALKCVVEGCNLEYDVVCSFSFYNVNVTSEKDDVRQEWIEGAMQEESECLWRHVSLQLCGYHFELDAQGLWIDSPMLPELLTAQEKEPTITLTEEEQKLLDIIRMEHNYSIEVKKEEEANVSRLNVRQLVDTLGYLSLKNLQRKQLWVAKVETDKNEASITQAEQVITKMQDPKQIIEIIPQSTSTSQTDDASEVQQPSEVLQILSEDGNIPENFIYEIAEEQEISMDEVKEIPSGNQEWMVNIVPDQPKPKYAYIKHCSTGKKKRHFTSEVNEITLQGDYDNYYILPDADPSVGVEITTSYEPENYIVQEYDHGFSVVKEEPKPRKRSVREAKDVDSAKKKKKRLSTAVKEQVRQIKTEMGEDWVIDNSVVYEDGEDYDDKKSRVCIGGATFS